MSIELNSPASPSKAPVSGGGNHLKGKANAVGQADAPDVGVFLSLLMAMGDDASAGGLPAGEDTAGKPLLAPDDAPGLPPDPAMLLAQSLQLPLSPQKGANGMAQEVQTQAADTSLATSVAASQGLAARDFRAEVASGLSRSNGAEAGAQLLTQAESTQLSIQQLVEQERSKAKASLSNNAVVPTSTAALALQAAADNAASDPRLLKRSFTEGLMESNPALPVALAATEAGAAGIRSLERQAEKFAVKQVGNGEGAWGHQALLAGPRFETAATMAGAAPSSPEMMAAEQVKYWISNNVQNAEMTLDGWGKSPVEVSISLQGLEARVEFRTDQPEVRQVLEGAASHLKEMLRNEGMVLSGVFVGSSGADGRQGAPERRPRPHNVQQTSISVPELAPVSADVRPGRSSGRVVDLFV